ncbi:AraC family transcriptional regulator [Alcanivorax sp. 1008]|uniref:AraC family transcriptional regulator n=1 Tax=Alcanivorax sp. 1008 TaxID=2816853 RepID=UPI001D5B3579|nr:AraC family transcriptional regulator [Alcanivorax sp. 1008]MCC1495395.1 AraC family transcriptional regulator [Alcanivorax sp. 1008]
MTTLTDSGVLLRMAYKAMQNAGVDADAVLAKVGLDKSILTLPELRTPHDAQEWFWQAMEEVSGDPHVGLHIGPHMPIFKGQVLEYLFLSSPTFGEGLKRALDYQRLLSDAANAELVDHGERMFLKQMLWSRKLAHLNECASVGVIKFFSFVTDGAFIPIEVHFSHPRHADQREYERVFGCPVKFEMRDVGIFFDRKLMDLPSAHHEPELLQLHERLASEQMARLEKQDLVYQVSRLVAELLESGHANLEEVAARLGIKPRQLRTRLADAGTNFNQLVAEYRCKLAKRLLAGTDENIDEIVYLTGFSEPSTFYRAFKRWVGMTPIEYRKLKSDEDVK